MEALSIVEDFDVVEDRFSGGFAGCSVLWFTHSVFSVWSVLFSVTTSEERGLSLLEMPELIGVGVASLFSWTKKPEPSKMRNNPVTKIDRWGLARDVGENPYNFQYERALRLGVSESCVGRALKRLKVSDTISPLAIQSCTDIRYELT